MRNLLALVGAALVSFLAVGYFLKWYEIETTTDSNGRRHIGIEVDKDKVTGDLAKVLPAKDQTNQTTVTPPSPPLNQQPVIQLPSFQPPAIGAWAITPVSTSNASPQSGGSWINPKFFNNAVPDTTPTYTQPGATWIYPR